jgi:predicted enzyme involved in methoxymalonyl-ACP biosynthesis
VAITNSADSVCEIDTFLMSCRVIGRTVETALLARIAEDARASGAKQLQGWFLPTKKNAPAQDFYRDHGFTEASRTDEGTLFTFDLTQSTIATPEWIKVV